MESNSMVYQGNIITSESRDVVDKLKKWYKEKIIDSGISQKYEAGIDTTAKAIKGVIKVVGVTATIILIICPADGPFGELLTALATPGLCALVDKIVDMYKNAAIGAKRTGEKFIGFEGQGNNPNVTGYTDLKQPIKDALSIRETAETMVDTMNKEKTLKK